MQPYIPMERVIFIELYAGTREYMKSMVPTVNAMNGVVANRRDVWPSREAAEKDLRRYRPWKYYDKGVWDLYLVRFYSYASRMSSSNAAGSNMDFVISQQALTTSPGQRVLR